MKRARLFAGLAAVLLAAGTTQAAPLATDPLTMAAWRGAKDFDSSGGGWTLDVKVEFAVYDKGDYPGSDPSGGSHYVYAYEIFNLAGGSADVTQVSIGLAKGSGAVNIGAHTPPPGTDDDEVSPTGETIGLSSAQWDFASLLQGEDSQTLRFTSPYGPQWMSGTVMDGGLSDQRDLPSPMPEPAAISLLALGGVGALLSHRRRRAA